MDAQFNALMAKLDSSFATDKVALLKQIAELFKRENTSPSLVIVKSSNLIKILAELMVKYKKQWMKRESWIYNMVLSIYSIMKFDVPLAHTKALIEVSVDYMKSTEEGFPPALLYAIAGRVDANISRLLYEHPVLHKRMQALSLLDSSASKAQCFFVQVTAFDDWKLRLLEDKQFLLDLVGKPIPDTWMLFSQLAKHTRASEFIPQVVVQKASLVDDEWCPAICAMLCTPSNAAQLKLNMRYVDTCARQLEDLLSNQDRKTISHYTLFGILFPLANLSVGEANKEPLGKLFIPLLKRALLVPNNCANPMINNLRLGEAKRLAAKILANFASVEANRERICEGGGLEGIKQANAADSALGKELDEILNPKPVRKARVKSIHVNPRSQQTEGLEHVSENKFVLKLDKPQESCRVHMLTDLPKVLTIISDDLADIVDECLETVVQKKAALPAGVPQLTDDEALALVAYSFDMDKDAKHNLYYVLNQVLREHDETKLKLLGPFLWYMMAAMSKLPEVQTTVYRGVPKTAFDQIKDMYEMGSAIHWSAFTSTTTNIDKAKSFARSKGFGGVILRIRIITGRNIQPYSCFEEEEEVLLSPNCKLQVIQPIHTEGNDGFNYVELAESKQSKPYIF